MFDFARSFGLALVLVALCTGGQAHAQAMAVQYWQPSSWFGFGGPGTPGLDGNDAQGARTNFPTGWYFASTRNDFAMSGFNRAAAFGSFGSLTTEGAQFGYTLKNTPLSVFAGFDTLKYNTGPGTAASGAFAAFDSRAATVPGAFSANTGIEYRPTNNLSLSLGVGVTQYQSRGLVDSDINSNLLPGQTPLAIGGRPLR